MAPPLDLPKRGTLLAASGVSESEEDVVKSTAGCGGTNLREYADYLISVGRGSSIRATVQQARTQEGWLAALRQDVLVGFETSLQMQLRRMQQDMSDGLGALRADVCCLLRGSAAAAAAAEEQGKAVCEIRASAARVDETTSRIRDVTERLHTDCETVINPIAEALDQTLARLQTNIEESRREVCVAVDRAAKGCREATEDARAGVYSAVDASRIQAAELQAELLVLHSRLHEGRLVAQAAQDSSSPVLLGAIARSTAQLSDMVARVREQPVSVDVAAVSAAVRDGAAAGNGPILEAIREAKLDLNPMVASIEAHTMAAKSPPTLDLSPLLAAVRDASQAAVRDAMLSRQPHPAPDLLRAVLAAVRETRAADMRQVLDAIDRLAATVDESLPNAGGARPRRRSPGARMAGSASGMGIGGDAGDPAVEALAKVRAIVTCASSGGCPSPSSPGSPGCRDGPNAALGSPISPAVCYRCHQATADRTAVAPASNRATT